MKLLATICIFIGLTWTTSIIAHDDVSLLSSSPKNNAMLMQSPELIHLEFSQAVRLIKVSLTSEEVGNINFDFKPQTESQAVYEWKLPILKPATYEVRWTILGEDGHAMNSSIGFMVH